MLTAAWLEQFNHTKKATCVLWTELFYRYTDFYNTDLQISVFSENIKEINVLHTS